VLPPHREPNIRCMAPLIKTHAKIEHRDSGVCLVALAPLDVVDLGKLEVGRVGGEQATGTWFCGRQVDLRVNVEWEVSSARRPN